MFYILSILFQTQTITYDYKCSIFYLFFFRHRPFSSIPPSNNSTRFSYTFHNPSITLCFITLGPGILCVHVTDGYKCSIFYLFHFRHRPLPSIPPSNNSTSKQSDSVSPFSNPPSHYGHGG